MIHVRNPDSLRHLVQLAAEHWSDAVNAGQQRAELDAQMAPLIEQLEALQAKREEWNREHGSSRDMAYDYSGMVTAACQANNWALPQGLPELPPLDPAAPGGTLAIEAEALAAHAQAPEVTAANQLPAADTNPEVPCPGEDCGRALVQSPRGWVHVNDSSPACDPAQTGAHRVAEEVPSV